MGTVGFLWTPGIKMGQFDLIWDPEDTEGMWRFCLFVPNPYNVVVYGIPWTPATKICHFELTQDL